MYVNTVVLLLTNVAMETQQRILCVRGVLINPQSDQEGNMLQQPISGYIQYTPHEAQYTS